MQGMAKKTGACPHGAYSRAGKKDGKQIDTREIWLEAGIGAMKEKNMVIWERIMEQGLIWLVWNGHDMWSLAGWGGAGQMCVGRAPDEGASICKGPGVGASLAHLRSRRTFVWTWSNALWGLWCGEKWAGLCRPEEGIRMVLSMYWEPSKCTSGDEVDRV